MFLMLYALMHNNTHIHNSHANTHLQLTHSQLALTTLPLRTSAWWCAQFFKIMTITIKSIPAPTAMKTFSSTEQISIGVNSLDCRSDALSSSTTALCYDQAMVASRKIMLLCRQYVIKSISYNTKVMGSYTKVAI